MAKYQVWLRGRECFDTEAKSPDEAKAHARNWLGKRLPRGTCVCEIPYDYYKEIVRLNEEAGFNASNE